MQDNNWFMFPPHNYWAHSITCLVKYLSEAETPTNEILKAVDKHPPKRGWTPQSRKFTQLAISLMAASEKKGGKYERR